MNSMVNETTTGGLQAQPCGTCSNGPSLVYHYGGPCPYLWPTPTAIGPLTMVVDTGEIHRAPLLQKIAELEAQVCRLQVAVSDALAAVAAERAINEGED